MAAGTAEGMVASGGGMGSRRDCAALPRPRGPSSVPRLPGAPMGQPPTDPGLVLGSCQLHAWGCQAGPRSEPGLRGAGAVLIPYLGTSRSVGPAVCRGSVPAPRDRSTKPSVPAQPCPLLPLPVSSRTDHAARGRSRHRTLLPVAPD